MGRRTATYPEYKKCFAWSASKCKVMTHKDCPNCNFYRSDIKYSDQVKKADAYVRGKREVKK